MQPALPLLLLSKPSKPQRPHRCCVAAPICCNFAFSLLLARRLDGDETIGARKILLPYIFSQLFSVMMLGLSAAPAPPDDAGASALGLPLGPFYVMVDGTAEALTRGLGGGDAAAAGIGRGLLAAEGVEDVSEAAGWARARQAYEARAPSELLREGSGTILYRTRADHAAAKKASGAASAEGSAAAAAAAGDGQDGPTEAPSTGASAVFGVCQICFEDSSVASTVLLPCGHGGLCRECGDAVAQRAPHHCHMCRQQVLKVATVEERGVDAETQLLRFRVVPEAAEPSSRP